MSNDGTASMHHHGKLGLSSFFPFLLRLEPVLLIVVFFAPTGKFLGAAIRRLFCLIPILVSAPSWGASLDDHFRRYSPPLS